MIVVIRHIWSIVLKSYFTCIYDLFLYLDLELTLDLFFYIYALVDYDGGGG